MPYTTAETDTKEAGKPSPPTSISKMDSLLKADPQDMRNIASRTVSLALKKMDQDAGLREIGAILHDVVTIEDASLYASQLWVL